MRISVSIYNVYYLSCFGIFSLICFFTNLSPGFEELLLSGLDNDPVGVAHHGDQHVEEEDGDEDLEEDKDNLGHPGVGRVAQQVIVVATQRHVEHACINYHERKENNVLKTEF